MLRGGSEELVRISLAFDTASSQNFASLVNFLPGSALQLTQLAIVRIGKWAGNEVGSMLVRIAKLLMKPAMTLGVRQG